jgi:hypothetical protein
MNPQARFCFQSRSGQETRAGFFDALQMLFSQDLTAEERAATGLALAKEIWSWLGDEGRSSRVGPDTLVDILFDRVSYIAGHAWLEIEQAEDPLMSPLSYYKRDDVRIPDDGEIWEFLPDSEWLVSRASLESEGATWSLEYLATHGLTIIFRPLFPSNWRKEHGRRKFPSVPGNYFSTVGSKIRRTPPVRRADRSNCWSLVIDKINKQIKSCAKGGRYSYEPHHPESYNCVTWVSWTLQEAAGLQWYSAVAEYHTLPVETSSGNFTTAYVILFETGIMSHAQRWLRPYNST